MASQFDPSAFIQAEREQQSQALANNSGWANDLCSAPKTPENRHSEPAESAAVAGIATLAGIGGQKLPWTDELEVWASGPCPDFVSPNLWDEITHEALTVSKRWGSIALDVGWNSLNLFGCHCRPQVRRLDHNGLVRTIVGLLTPVRIVSLGSECAELLDHNGSVMRFRPRHKPGAVHLWEAYTMPAGP